MGNIYYHGDGVSKDYIKAAQWYEKAAEQGIASAQYNLGGMYEMGLGVPKDPRIAGLWYIKATEQGHAKAQYRLGLLALSLNMPSENACWWLAGAADQGIKEALDAYNKHCAK